MQDSDLPQRKNKLWNSTLSRKTPLKKSSKPIAKSAKPLKRGGKPKPQSDKMIADLAIYRIRRPLFLAANPVCQMNLTDCSKESTEVHHKLGRGVYLLDESTWLAACRICHNWATEHSKEAIEMGLSERRNTTPKKRNTLD